MEIEQLVKKLNNTELGKTGTHERYIQIPKDLYVSDIFPNAEEEIEFIDKQNNNGYKFRLTIGREHRICGLGDYYRDKKLSAGDEILLEMRVINGKANYFVSCRKLLNTVTLRKDSNGYEILTPDKLHLITSDVIDKISGLPIKIEFKHEAKKRADASEYTRYYDVFIGEKLLNKAFSKQDIIEIEVSNNCATITSDFLWKRISLKQEV